MNTQEQVVHDALASRGFDVLRNGWPDFLVLSKDWKRGFAVEYKSKTDRVSPSQERMHLALARFGIKTYIAGPKDEALLRKRGSALVMPEDYQCLKNSYEQLCNEVRMMQRTMEGLAHSLESLPVLLNPPSEKMAEVCDLGILIDAEHEPDRVEHAMGRNANRKMEKHFKRATGTI